MKITYDSEADAMYIYLRDAAPCESRDVDDGVLVDLDVDGHVVGIEILDVGERMGGKPLTSITFEDLVSEKVSVLPTAP